jgi:hypothetical protein
MNCTSALCRRVGLVVKTPAWRYGGTWFNSQMGHVISSSINVLTFAWANYKPFIHGVDKLVPALAGVEVLSCTFGASE